jgi:hypothetical protein
VTHGTAALPAVCADRLPIREKKKLFYTLVAYEVICHFKKVVMLESKMGFFF